jgi:beta-carotene 3-hydroxylase
MSARGVCSAQGPAGASHARVGTLVRGHPSSRTAGSRVGWEGRLVLDVVALALLALVVAVLMEGVAWLTHRYVMHGLLWTLHEDHHRPRGRGLQKNDLFAVFFASISFLLFLFGSLYGVRALFALGSGVALYGVGYFAFHDIMFHRRVPGLRLRSDRPYLKRIVAAHRVHHQRSTRNNGTSFGFLYANKSYDKYVRP